MTRISIPDPIADAEALVRGGEARRAIALLQGLVAAGRGGLLTRIALGRALLSAGDIEGALAALREASSLAPDIADCALALGEALLVAGHLPTAIAEFQRALRLEPRSVPARFKLGCAWLEAGEPSRALEFFMDIPESPAVIEKRESARAMQTASRMPAGYVRHLFDQFSSDYDTRMLQHLHYAAPLHLRALADLVLATRGPPFRILDLGCGSGLSGLAFADLAVGGRIDGIDLSPRMIELARARGVYGELAVADIENLPQAPGPNYDLVLAADTLVYLGDLSRVFACVHAQLAAGGYFFFTVERVPDQDFDLGPKRRYRHSEEYVRKAAQRAGFEAVGLVACSPRSEAGQAVDGLAVALEKP